MTLPSRHELPPRRTGHAAPETLLASRASGAATSVPPLAAGITARERTIEGVRVIELAPDGPASGTIVHFHGGGYRQGNPDRMQAVLSQIAARTGCRVLAPAYALAPEAPFPAAIHDARAVLAAVVAQHPGEPLIISGDSAGGGLAVAACLAFGEALPALRGAVLVSPWLDLTGTAPTFASRAQTDYLFSRESALSAAEFYLQGTPADHPLASPLHAQSLEGMPPALIVAGSAEVLLQDSVDFAARLAAQHIGVELTVVPHMQHISPMLFPDLPSTEHGLDLIVRFIAARIAGRGPIADPPADPPAPWA